jgi:nucleotide-binding universal stress UspA family protein
VSGRIVVGVDGSEAADRALAFAAKEARMRGVDLEAVHAWSFPALSYTPYGPAPTYSDAEMEEAATATLDHALARVDLTGISVTPRLVMGGSAPALLDAAEGADLLVVGSRGHGGFAGLLLGSTSMHCAHHPPCPLVIVP